MEPTTGAPVPPPPPPGVPVKKKTSPLVWILVGCLGLFIIGGVIFAAATFFVAKKAKGFIEEASANPIRTAAETMVRLNPELELVSTDDEAQTMTIRNTTTGEVSTFDWSDIQNGNMTFESTGADGETESATFGMGGSDVPSWFPQYPAAAEVSVLVNATQDGQESMIWTFTTTDEVADVLGFYEQNLNRDGWTASRTDSTAGDVSNGSIDATSGEGARTVNMVVSKSGADPTQVMVTYTGTPGG
jgi:hypothetical protein